MPSTAASVQTLLILRQNRDYSFVWKTATQSRWHSLTLTAGQEQELARTFAQVTQEATHLAQAKQDKRSPAEETLLRLGRTMFQQLLSEALQEELRALPINAPLSLMTNDTLLPWELLTIDDTPLALRQVLCRQWLTTQKGRVDHWSAKPQLRCLLIGNPTGDLPAAEAEIEALIEVLDAAPHVARTDWFGGKLEQEQFLALLASRDYDLVHFAGHARPGALRLADGWLEAQRIQQAVNGAPFIFLNACASAQDRVAPFAASSLDETASASPYAGQSVNSLANAFLAGGASGFLGTLWPVPDETARQVAVDFYRLALQGYDTGEALQQARLRSHQQSAQTLVWAAAVLYGNPQQRLFATVPRQRKGTVLVIEQPLAAIHQSVHAGFAGQDLEQQRVKHWASVINRYGGTVAFITPVQVIAMFGAEKMLEDDAERSLHTALALLAPSVDNIHPPPALSVASGPLIIVDQSQIIDNTLRYWGETVTTALQLVRQAQPGEVLVNAQTRQQTQHRFAFVAIEQPIRNRDAVGNPANGSPGHTCYRLAIDAEQAKGRTPPPLLLVEREIPLAKLREFWRLTEQGQGSVVGVIGEAGIGKSALIETFCSTEHIQPLRCLRLAAVSVNADRPSSFLGDFLRLLLEISPRTNIAGCRQQVAERLAAFPQLAARPGLLDLLLEVLGGTRAPLTDEYRQRLRQDLTRLIQRLLEAASQPTPLLIFWDDAQFIDVDSVELLTPLAEWIDRQRLLLVMAFRPGRKPVWPGDYAQIQLRPLSAQGEQQLLQQALTSDDLPSALQQAFRKLAGLAGNPGDIIDWLDHLQREAILQRQGGLWQVTRPLQTVDLAETNKRSQLIRVERLEPRLQQTLRVAAVVDQGFTPRLLAEVLDETEPEMVDRLIALQIERLIQEDPNSTGYQFTTAKMRAVLYADLAPQQRMALHRQVADALCDDRQPDLFLLAHHYGESNDRASAIRYVLRAADQAAAEWNNLGALEHYSRAVANVSTLLESKPTVLEEKRGASAEMIESWRRNSLEGSADIQGRIGENERAIIFYHDLLATAQNPPSLSILKQADLLRKLAIAQHNSGQLDQARQSVEQGLTLLDGVDGVDRGKLLIWHSILAFRRADYHAALATSQQACTQLQQEASELARARNLQCILYQRLGNLAEAVKAGEESVATYCQLNHQLGLARALSNLGIVYLNLGDWSEALKRFLEGQKICEKTGESRQSAATTMDLGEVYRRQGELAQALACHEKACQQGEALAMPEIQGAALLNLGVVYLKLGQWVETEKALTQCERVLKDHHLNLYQAELLRSQAELALRQGQTVKARMAAQTAYQWAEQAGDATELALVQRILGQIDRHEQNFVASHTNLTTSLVYLQQQGNRYESAINLLELAFLYAEQLPFLSSPAERVAQQQVALTHCEEALHTFTTLGAQLDQELAQQLQERLRSSSWQS